MIMNAQLFILTQLDAAWRQATLDDLSVPSWEDGQFVRASVLQFERGDVSVWQDFLDRMSATDWRAPRPSRRATLKKKSGSPR